MGKNEISLRTWWSGSTLSLTSQQARTTQKALRAKLSTYICRVPQSLFHFDIEISL